MTCAFAACGDVDACALEGGCVTTRFAHVPTYARAETLKKGARALAGTKPARTNRDPAVIARSRTTRSRTTLW